jgi:hypothetical protein|nr:MAG TPA: NinB protein [Caudoviricetes sp.]
MMAEQRKKRMETEVTISNISIDFKSGKQVLSVLCEKDIRGEYYRLRDKKCNLKLTQYRKKRSLNANSYFHKLVSEIAKVLEVNMMYIKNKMIAEYGQYEYLGGRLVEIALDQDLDVYTIEEHHLQPTPKLIVDENGEVLRVNLMMRGSHTYNTKEMSDLITGTVQEAKELDIETETPQAIREMSERWGIELEKAN